MRVSELMRAIDTEFGSLGRVLYADLALPGLDGRTGSEAIADGVRARDVWQALCLAKDVPPERIHGAGLEEPRG